MEELKEEFLVELLKKISEIDKNVYKKYLVELYEMLEEKYDIFIWY